MRKELNLGNSDFKSIIENNNYFVDKTLLIKEILSAEKAVLLFPRPRRFGKTLNLSMLRYFFDIRTPENKELFKDLKIWNEKEIIEKHCCQYPVIYLTFKDAKADTWDLMYQQLTETISKLYQAHSYLLESDFLIKKEKNDFIFINVARFEPQKNHKLLINAFYKANLDAKLYLIGDGYLREDLELKIKDLGLQDRVKLLGRQKNPYKFLSKADCFVFSSNYEGFPNVLLEALLCNLPIISTDCKSGPREILAPNTPITKETENIEIAEYGILTKVGSVEYMAEAMKLIYKDNNLRYNFTQKAQNRIKEFEVKKIIEKWEEVIEKV